MSVLPWPSPSSLCRTVNGIERVLKVSIGAQYVRVSGLHVIENPGSTPCFFGLLPEFSTPVEKTVENHNFRRWAVILARFYADFSRAKALEPLILRPLRR